MKDVITISRKELRDIFTQVMDKEINELSLSGRAQAVHTLVSLTFAADVEIELFKEDEND